MSKRTKRKRDESESEEEKSGSESDSGEEKPVRRSGRRVTKKLRGAKDESDSGEEEEKPTRRSERKSAKKQEGDDVTVNKNVKKCDQYESTKVYSWTPIEQSLYILDSSDIEGSEKIAAFDMDSTLIAPKSKGKFPNGRNDWRWQWDSVPKILKSIAKDGYKIVIFSNQGGVKKGHTKVEDILGKVLDIVKDMGLQGQVQAFVACGEDGYRKPWTIGYDLFLSKCNGGLIPSSDSYYCGDAAGRVAAWNGDKKTKKDFSCTDRKFAENTGLKFRYPEDIFLTEEEKDSMSVKLNEIEWDWGSKHPKELFKAIVEDSKDKDYSREDGKQEMVIMVGSPASGKSTFSQKNFISKKDGTKYIRVSMDDLKSKPKCKKVVEEALGNGRSVVIDNTNPTKEARSYYIKLAKNVPIRCFYLNTTKELSVHLNSFRQAVGSDHAHVPMVVFHTYFKKLEEPKKSEGFESITEINFTPDTASWSDRDKKMLVSWSS